MMRDFNRSERKGFCYWALLRVLSFIAIMFETLVIKHKYSSKKDAIESVDLKFWFIEPRAIEKI